MEQWHVTKDSYSLTYLLGGGAVFSPTAYKVLQAQQVGFVKCFHTLHNGRDKLVFDIENLPCLGTVLPSLASRELLAAVGGVLDGLLQVYTIGFLQAGNVQIHPELVFLSPGSLKPLLVYLPVDGLAFNPQMHLQTVKDNLCGMLRALPAMQTPNNASLVSYLASPTVSLEQMRAALNSGVSEGTGVAGVPGTDSLSLAGQDVPIEQAEQTPAAHEPSKKEKTKRAGLFNRSKKKVTPAFVAQSAGGDTEVLEEIFIPSLALEGVHASKRYELLVDKNDYILGKKADGVDGLVDCSNAVSRRHCRILCREGKNYIEDLGSANGTFINGKKLAQGCQQPLKAGDKLKLANVDFTIKAV